ncbi:MAG: hypothetical protein ACI9JL_001673 [Paracoccaceae bacterium]|jgi:hypothetical protein
MKIINIAKRLSLTLVVGFALFLAPASADATLLIEIQRINDTTGVVSGSGTILPGPPGFSSSTVSLRAPFAIGPSGGENDQIITASTMQIGGHPVVISNLFGQGTAGSGGFPWMSFSVSGGPLAAGDTITGSFTFELPAPFTLAAIGSVGVVSWGLANTGVGAGSWTMVAEATAISAPAPIALLGFAVLGIGFVRRRMR